MDIAKPNEAANDFKSLDILESHLVSSVLVRVGSIHRMLYGQSVLITYALSRTDVTLTIYRTYVFLTKCRYLKSINSAILGYVLQFLCDNLHNRVKFSIIVVTFCVCKGCVD